jgi:phosphate transport system substrate-binding protein
MGGPAAVIAGATLMAAVVTSGPAQARDRIRIVGSGTVFPFTSAVGDAFASRTGFKAPVVEATGTVAGLKLLCAGVGDRYPDIANASRRMTAEEFERCAAHQVGPIVELKIGYDGIVVATRKGGTALPLTSTMLWKALSARLPDHGSLIDNPNRSWHDVDPGAPDLPIEVLGPPPTSGTRDVFIERVMRQACLATPDIQALDSDTIREQACGPLREDGVYIEAGEYYHLIVQRLAASHDGAIGLFGFSYYDQNRNVIDALPVDGVDPTPASIVSGRYPLARPLFLYVKIAHLTLAPGIREFLGEYVGEEAVGPKGYLTARGLIPLPGDLHAASVAMATNLTPMSHP